MSEKGRESEKGTDGEKALAGRQKREGGRNRLECSLTIVCGHWKGRAVFPFLQ
jgi:hypothetical protein